MRSIVVLVAVLDRDRHGGRLQCASAILSALETCLGLAVRGHQCDLACVGDGILARSANAI